jgi:hypothetical protein
MDLSSWMSGLLNGLSKVAFGLKVQSRDHGMKNSAGKTPSRIPFTAKTGS